ncbi:glycosyltransferase family 4 protein [Hyphomicrobium sp.]|uniref:glycosyltransferase family 4 protein n=1 Tax=Hyphomicrobium sp. TaxID=82 RepID=UPI002D79153D|nr:glycosyltransferase family 4 protein [Hyphomicrobium sp.]HET6389433.1 glycosyltransferase family 4 protein [Hyphomicrobium sp.]
MAIRTLFLNTRDTCGADVAVHLTLMANFTSDEAEVFVISNSDASDAEEMRARLAGMPQVRSSFLPLGKPAEYQAGKGLIGKALAYGPSAASLAKVAAFIRRNRIQIIHTTDRPRDASYGSLLGRATGTPSIVQMHSHLGDYHTAPTLWGMRNATAIFAISDYIRNGLGQMGLDLGKIHTIYNAVDTDHFDPRRELGAPASIRSDFGIPDNARLLGIAARMNPWKGQRELIGAVALLRQSHPQLHVMILGADVPEFRSAFERMAREGGIADRVHFAGYQSDVRPFLREFDIFVHPSYAEPFGLAIAEAMAMEKPVIACGTGGVPEIITHNLDGRLVEERSAEAVAAEIASLIGDADLRRRLGECARQTILRRFTPRLQCSEVARRYAGLVAASNGEAMRNIPSSLGVDGGSAC